MAESNRQQCPVEVSNLRKTFGDQQVLNGLNLQVQRGETIAVLGRSGTGKSVLLKLLIRLLSPDAGSIRVAEKEIGKLSVRELNEVRKRVGFLFQQGALYDSLTVEENVAFPLRRHVRMRESELKRRVRELLATVDMEQHTEKLPAQISGGMKKRVGLARALALDPEILLFDEPTAGLDPVTSSEISHLIAGLNAKRKLTALVVTHDVESAKVFAERVVLLDAGRIAAQGTWDNLEDSQDEFVQKFLRPAH